MAIEVAKVILENVSDASGMEALIDANVFSADEVIAVIGKTEGNGGVNDFTRILADNAFRDVLIKHGSRPEADVKQIPMVWSGGVDGVLCPHATVFARVPGQPKPEPRLTVRFAMSDTILPEQIGRPAMVEKVAEGVRRAMADAGIADPADVHYVQTKTPLLTMETIAEAKARGKGVITEQTLESMDISNGTTALGIAVALGEIEMPTAIRSAMTCRCSHRWPRVPPASSWTRPRPWSSATLPSGVATGLGTAPWPTHSTSTVSTPRSVLPVSTSMTAPGPRTWAIAS